MTGVKRRVFKMIKPFFKQNLHIIVSLLSYLIVFSGLFLRALYGLSFYLVPSMVFLISFIINYAYLRRYWVGDSAHFNVLSFITHLAVFVLSGLLAGLGFNTLLMTPLGYVLNSALAISTVLYLESFRSELVFKNLKHAGPLTVFIALSIMTSLMYTLVFEGAGISMTWFIKYLSLTAYSIVLSLIARRFSFKTQAITMTSYVVFFRLAPVIPARTTILLTTLPLITLSILLPGLLHLFSKPITLRIIPFRPRRRGRLLTIFLTALSFAFFASFLFGVRFFAVSSGSMTPSINVGDVVVSAPTSPGGIKPGDVIVFKGGSSIIVHRVIEPAGDDCFITRGDANESPDPLWACGGSIIGRVVFTIPMIGWTTLYLLQATGSLNASISLILSLLSLIYVYYIVRGVVRY